MRDIELIDRRRELEWPWVNQLHPTVESHALEGGNGRATRYRLNAADALVVKTTLEYHQIARGRIASAPHVRFHIECIYVESRHTAHNLRPCNRRGQYFQGFESPNIGGAAPQGGGGSRGGRGGKRELLARSGRRGLRLACPLRFAAPLTRGPCRHGPGSLRPF